MIGTVPGCPGNIDFIGTSFSIVLWTYPAPSRNIP